MSEEDSTDYAEDTKRGSHFMSGLFNDDGTNNSAPAKKARKRVSMEWSAGAVEMLISAVKSYDLLWNTANPDYRSRGLRNRAWDCIAQDVFYGECDSEQLSAKWGNLRVQFNSYLNKIKNDEAGQEAGVTWKYYHAMMFIAGPAGPQQSSESDVIKKFKRAHKDKSSARLSEPEARKISKLEPVDISEILSEKAVPNVATKPDKLDSFQAFGNFIAAELRKIPDSTVANRMQRKLTRFFMDCLDEADASNSLYSSDPDPAATAAEPLQ